MAEYIEREAAIAYIRDRAEERQRAFDEFGAESNGIYADAYNDLAEDFYKIPSADVAPVVRCKYCGNFRQNGYGACWCNEYGGTITPEGYCSRAVLRTNATTPQRAIPWEAD